MAINFSIRDGIGLIAVEEAMTAATADSFREQFVNWHKSESGIKDCIVDLSAVEMMDSAGLGALMAVLKRVTENGGDLKIACLQKKPRMVFEITRAYKVFEILDTVDEAVAACS